MQESNMVQTGPSVSNHVLFNSATITSTPEAQYYARPRLKWTDFDAYYFTVAEGLLAMDCFRICDVRDRTLSGINKMPACSGPL